LPEPGTIVVGLDIVRKGLGRHEIATIQTTAIEKDGGLAIPISGGTELGSANAMKAC
jgi:hypothetical protein